MPVTVDWDDDERKIIALTFEIGWKLEELYHAMAKANTMIERVGHSVYGYLVDDSREALPPASAITAFKQALSADDLPMAFVQPNHAARIMIDTVRKVYRIQRPVYYTRSRAEARRFIHKHHQQRHSS